jgi:ribosomal protein S18 acetylase RimI-like enzyme
VAGQRLERRLLDHVLETLMATPGLRRIEAQLPHFDREQLEPAFLAHKFRSYQRRFMKLRLGERPGKGSSHGESTAPPPARKLRVPGDIRLIPWHRGYDQEAAELLYQAYRHHVDAVINDQYASVTGATRLLENIVYHQGCGEFLPRISQLAVHHPSEMLAGLLTVTAIRRPTAHIPQVAVAAAFQGRGVGTALMDAAFEDLDQDGFDEVTLTVTDANAGALRLYEKIGFETFKEFGAFIYNRDGIYSASQPQD